MLRESVISSYDSVLFSISSGLWCAGKCNNIIGIEWMKKKMMSFQKINNNNKNNTSRKKHNHMECGTNETRDPPQLDGRNGERVTEIALMTMKWTSSFSELLNQIWNLSQLSLCFRLRQPNQIGNVRRVFAGFCQAWKFAEWKCTQMVLWTTNAFVL